MKVRAAIVGLGRIGSLLEDDPKREKPCTHAGAIASSKDAVLAAGADRDEQRRRLFAEKWGGIPVYASAETMLAEQKPDILCIATHPDSHYYYCELAARCGVKVVICEKPLADTLAGAKKIAGLQQSGKILIITNHERRYSRDYHEAKTWLESGKPGRLLSVKAALYMGKTRRLLDVLWHDGTHLADAAMFLAGARLRHKKTWGGKLSGRKGTAFLAGTLCRKNAESILENIPFLMELGAERDHLVFELEFSCEQGRLRIGNGIFEIWESAPSPYAESFRSLQKTADGFSGPTGYFSNMIQDAVDCLRRVYTPPFEGMYPETNTLQQQHTPSACGGAACFDANNQQPLSGASDGLQAIMYLNSIKPW